uniref:F-box protein AT5G49610-like beta-propeller domain-containing protein n=1 Tax=Aegilops tauschii subsp. strangulata TaxID=200361 RepID=A0A453GGZ1_AEGTS
MEGQTPPDSMQGEARPPPAYVSKVLEDDNLLTEIIVRVGFPTSLVRAACVCRRWLSHASDRAFLRRFRELHPPRLLGFYLAQGYPYDAARFFPMLPQPPELAAVIRRTNFSKKEGGTMVGCSNGSVLTRRMNFSVLSLTNSVLAYELVFAVHSPLCYDYDRGMAILPGLQFTMPCLYNWAQLFSKEEGDGSSYFYVTVEDTMEPKVNVYMLQTGDDAWQKHLTLGSDRLLHPQSSPKGVLVDSKIYFATDNAIVVLDLTSSILSAIQLPHGVGFDLGTTMLSRVDDGSGVYLIHIKELQLHIWLHNGDNWLLVDTICLSETCAGLLEDEPTADIRINHVGDYNGFVFLEMGRSAHYLDVRRRTLCKVYEMTTEEKYLGDIYPLMMTWAPFFPTVRPARFAF